MEELLENLIPLYNKEFYLAYLCSENVVLPIPDGNAERYLAYLCGMDVTIPDVPDGRTETYLAYKCGEDVVLPDPMYRIEFYLAKWCGMDVEVPEPLYRIEYWLAQLANSGELKTVTGNPISVSDALAKPAESLSIEILPQQDLHGYDNPWPAGGGKNLLPPPSVISSPAWATVTNDNGKLAISGTSDGATISWTMPSFSFAASGQKIALMNSFTGGTVRFYSNGTQLDYFSLTTANRVLAESSITTLAGKTIDEIRIQINAQTILNDATISIMVLDSSADASIWNPYSNLCPISGFTGVNIYHESAYDPDADPTYAIDWTDEAGTVYGGSLDVVSGVMTSVPYYGSYNGEPLVGPWVSSMDKYVAGTTPTIGAQVVDMGGTGTNIQLSATDVELLEGNNTIWNDVGDMTLEYLADGPAEDIDALQILLGNRYVNNGGADEATDKEALEILLGGNTR